LNRHLGSNPLSKAGPFVIGNTITYADLVIYQICHDENLTQDGRETLREYPHLDQLVEAVESRENIKKFMQSERYLG
jgi:prostaglandin-H2 D-isomerase / glutathione transferase